MDGKKFISLIVIAAAGLVLYYAYVDYQEDKERIAHQRTYFDKCIEHSKEYGTFREDWDVENLFNNSEFNGRAEPWESFTISNNIWDCDVYKDADKGKVVRRITYSALEKSKNPNIVSGKLHEIHDPQLKAALLEICLGFKTEQPGFNSAIISSRSSLEKIDQKGMRRHEIQDPDHEFLYYYQINTNNNSFECFVDEDRNVLRMEDYFADIKAISRKIGKLDISNCIADKVASIAEAYPEYHPSMVRTFATMECENKIAGSGIKEVGSGLSEYEKRQVAISACIANTVATFAVTNPEYPRDLVRKHATTVCESQIP